MCGILVYLGNNAVAQQFESARDLMQCRGPDGAGLWLSGPVWMGHRRLKIIDLSESATQPMTNEDNTVGVVFNGEIYNFPELRRDLEAKGHRFKSKSDTEVIVHGYEEYGNEIVERLWGMFAFAIWDSKRMRLLLGRDRYGKKPLVYTERDGQFAAASTIPALLKTGVPRATISMQGLSFFWQWEYIPAPYSAYSDIKKLPAGHAMEYENGKVRIWRYYPPSHVEPFHGSFEDACSKFEMLLEDATRRRLVSDVLVGVTLSAGLDSSSVATMARQVHQGRLVTLTVRPKKMPSATDEGEIARAVAKTLGTEHHEIECAPDLRTSLVKILSDLGEPLAVASLVPAFYVFKSLSQYATVVLTGDGGDESFAGYGHYFNFRRVRLAKALLPAWLLKAGQAWAEVLYASLPFMRQPLKLALAGSNHLLGRRFYDSRFEFRQALKQQYVDKWLFDPITTAFSRTLDGLVDDQHPVRREMLREQFDRMTYHILTKVDVASMASSVEARSPLLDHRIGEFARSLPFEYLATNAHGKQLQRAFLRKHHDSELLKWPKTGFGLPLREHFATDLRAYLTEVLTAPHAVYDAFVRRDQIPLLIARHAAGKPFLTRLLFQLLVFRLWLESNPATI